MIDRPRAATYGSIVYLVRPKDNVIEVCHGDLRHRGRAGAAAQRGTAEAALVSVPAALAVAADGCLPLASSGWVYYDRARKKREQHEA